VTRNWILKRAVVIVGACLGLAWFGAMEAAEQPRGTEVDTSSPEEGLQLIKSDAESVIVELIVPSFQIDEAWLDGELYHLVSVPECGATDEVGKPQLPVRATLLGIPGAAEYSLQVLELEQETLAGRYNVYPVPQPVLERDAEGNPLQISYDPARDEATYSSDASYPAEVAAVGSSGFIRDQRVLQLRLYPFQYDPVSGELTYYQRIRVELRFAYPGGRAQLLGARPEDGSFQEVFRNALLNYDSARQWRTTPSAASFSQGPALGEGQPSYKVVVDEDGIYQLTYADLQGAGMNPGSIDPLDFELYNQGQEVAIQVADVGDDGHFDEEDYILFYGQQMTTTYTRENVYWLTTGISDGLRMAEKDGTLGASTVLTYFETTRHWEVDSSSLYKSWLPEPHDIPSEEEVDRWFGDYVRAPDRPARNFVLSLDQYAVSSPPYSGTLRGYLVGADTTPITYNHHAEVYLNGYLLHDALWSGQGAYEFQTSVSDSLLLAGNNTIKVKVLLTAPEVADLDVVYVNWFEIDYRRTYTTENDWLFFDGGEAGTWQYQVGGFSTDTIDVFDVTDPFSVTRIVSTTVEQPGTYTVEFQDSIGSEHHYLALAQSEYKSPVEIVEDDPSDLKSTSNGADYIIITHPDFHDAVLPLRDYRATQGLRVEVVDVVDIYDEFSYGIFNPRAIREFLDYAYHHWVAPAPSYVLLVGDGHYDFLNVKGYGEPNYVPPYLMYADLWQGETATDNRYVCVSGDDELADMYIGRLPARTVDQVTTMISKTLDYETDLPEGDWTREVLFVSDDPDDPDNPDSANHFWSLADDVADNHVPPAPLYVVDKAYYGIEPYETPSDMTYAIADAFGTGRLFVNYVGHAGPLLWGGGVPAHLPFLRSSDVDDLPSSDRTPVVMAMACMEGYFIFPNSTGSDSLSCVAERLIRVDGKGSVANWSPASFGTSSGQHYLHVGFYDAVFRGRVYELGPATALGKLNFYQHTGADHRELIDTYMIFGDPALKLPLEDTYYTFVPLSLKGY
jgi:hypothetical protein